MTAPTIAPRTERQGIVMGGDYIERFKDSGFVDIKVTKQNNYFGNWVGGFIQFLKLVIW